jgi:hypothetical protein
MQVDTVPGDSAPFGPGSRVSNTTLVLTSGSSAQALKQLKSLNKLCFRLQAKNRFSSVTMPSN